MHITETLKRIVAHFFQSFLDVDNRRREAYLAEATDLIDLEMRQRELSRGYGRTCRYA
jgi:hypothetical protein